MRSISEGGASVAAEVVLSATHTGALELGGGETLDPTGHRIRIPAVWIFGVGPHGISPPSGTIDTAALMSQLGMGQR